MCTKLPGIVVVDLELCVNKPTPKQYSSTAQQQQRNLLIVLSSPLGFRRHGSGRRITGTDGGQANQLGQTRERFSAGARELDAGCWTMDAGQQEQRTNVKKK